MNDFSDVPLVSDDGSVILAHKMILALADTSPRPPRPLGEGKWKHGRQGPRKEETDKGEGLGE